MPVLRVEMFIGRDQTQKRALVQKLTDGFIETCGGTPESVHIIIEERRPEDWAVAGRLVSDRPS